MSDLKEFRYKDKTFRAGDVLTVHWKDITTNEELWTPCVLLRHFDFIDVPIKRVYLSTGALQCRKKDFKGSTTGFMDFYFLDIRIVLDIENHKCSVCDLSGEKIGHFIDLRKANEKEIAFLKTKFDYISLGLAIKHVKEVQDTH